MDGPGCPGVVGAGSPVSLARADLVSLVVLE